MSGLRYRPITTSGGVTYSIFPAGSCVDISAFSLNNTSYIVTLGCSTLPDIPTLNPFQGNEELNIPGLVDGIEKLVHGNFRDFVNGLRRGDVVDGDAEANVRHVYLRGSASECVGWRYVLWMPGPIGPHSTTLRVGRRSPKCSRVPVRLEGSDVLLSHRWGI